MNKSSWLDNQEKFVSKEMVAHKLAPGRYAVWNRFFPAVLVLNQPALDSLHSAIDNRLPTTAIRRLRRVGGELIRRSVLHTTQKDPSREAFFQSLDVAARYVVTSGLAISEGRTSYSNLHIGNNACNLRCPYCVSAHSRKTSRRLGHVIPPRSNRRQKLLHIIEQYMNQTWHDGAEHVKSIDFNGGEILLEFALIKEIVAFVSSTWPSVNAVYTINTNMTLVDREVASFLHDHKIRPYLSIDGYGRAHDATRVYRNGRGSFDDVIRGMKLYNEYNAEEPIRGFQGTIQDAETFDEEAFFRMANRGFVEARLAPNLLGVSVEDAVRKAHLMADLFENSARRKLRLWDAYFENIINLFRSDDVKFFFPCNGLPGVPHVGLGVNIDTLRLTQVCSFVPAASVTFEEVQGNIRHPKLAALRNQFIRDRFDRLRTDCVDCDVVGICRGGCILNGLDEGNQLNAAACAYQRTLWRRMVEFAYRKRRCASRQVESSAFEAPQA